MSSEKLLVENLTFYYVPEAPAIKDISLKVDENSVMALIGPSGCGKSTFLRCLNRMNDIIPNTKYVGNITIDGEMILADDYDVTDLRKRVGMVFQKPNPFPKSIRENISYGMRINGIKDKNTIEEKVEETLKATALWDEVKDRLDESALNLSGGQQQRLCIARTIAIEPEVILMDEPASALDPISTQKIEELIQDLKEKFTIVIVTHNMQQAARVSDFTAFFYMGSLIEVDKTEVIFTNPNNEMTENYITGKFG
ncbi:MAG: phosphate ABC transporter ATP-binding protein PstB [Spirochaetota bacterium]